VADKSHLYTDFDVDSYLKPFSFQSADRQTDRQTQKLTNATDRTVAAGVCIQEASRC